MNGIIKFYKKQEGFGFITCEGQDYFMHAREIKNVTDKEVLQSGMRVCFEPETGMKGKFAKNVRVLD